MSSFQAACTFSWSRARSGSSAYSRSSMRRLNSVKRPEQGEKCLFCRADGSGDGAPQGFGVLGFVHRIAGKLLGECLQVLDCQFVLFFAASRESEQDHGKRLQVISIFSGLFHFGHAQGFIAMDAPKPQNKSCGSGEGADDEISDSWRNENALTIRMLPERKSSV